MKKTLIWLVISAAFIGPGTVTTATSAGANFGTALLWTIPLAVFTCIVLQEGAARISIITGKPLGKVLIQEFSGALSTWIIPVTIVLGCAAYEAGNILGAVGGVELIASVPTYIITLILSSIAGLLLFTGRFKVLTNTLAALIGIMGLGLIIVVPSIPFDSTNLKNLIIPVIQPGSELIILGLIGTTVVPYNLFLGSRLAEGQSLPQMRRGLIISVAIGGLITLSLMLIGTIVTGDFSFSQVAYSISQLTGEFGGFMFAFGLFAAGLTSTITAPWAAATLLTSVKEWRSPNNVFTLTWLGVLATGLVFGVLQVQPIPVIILAQALNGFILPILTYAIYVLLNQKRVMGEQSNTRILNVSILFVFILTTVLGLLNVLKATYKVLNMDQSISSIELIILIVLGVVAAVFSSIKK